MLNSNSKLEVSVRGGRECRYYNTYNCALQGFHGNRDGAFLRSQQHFITLTQWRSRRVASNFSVGVGYAPVGLLFRAFMLYQRPPAVRCVGGKPERQSSSRRRLEAPQSSRDPRGQAFRGGLKQATDL